MSETTKPEIRTLVLKVRDIINFEQALGAVGRIEGLPIRTSYRFARLITKLQPEYEMFNKKRVELVQKYGDPIEGQPDQYRVAPERQDHFQTEMDTLLDEVVEVPSWMPVTLEDFGSAEGRITAMQLAALMPLLHNE